MVHRWRCGPKIQLLPHQVVFSADQKDCCSKIYENLVHVNVCQISYFASYLQIRLLSNWIWISNHPQDLVSIISCNWYRVIYDETIYERMQLQQLRPIFTWHNNDNTVNSIKSNAGSLNLVVNKEMLLLFLHLPLNLVLGTGLRHCTGSGQLKQAKVKSAANWLKMG